MLRLTHTETTLSAAASILAMSIPEGLTSTLMRVAIAGVIAGVTTLVTKVVGWAWAKWGPKGGN
jgi:hypothetical protein